jgi:hypothetical protein
MALWPLIIVKTTQLRSNKALINHEKIHHRQQLELLILPYHIWYFTEYALGLIKYRFNHDLAYRSISFEKEAYANQGQLDFLKKRPFLNHLKFFK